MIVKYAYLVKYIAARISSRLPSNVIVDELISAGCLGLIDAVDKYDHKKDVSLKTYAQYRIKGAILDELRSMDWYSRSMRKKIQDIETAVKAVENREGRPAQENEVAKELKVDLAKYHKMLADIHGAALLSLDSFISNGSDTQSRKTFQERIPGTSDSNRKIETKELKHVVANSIRRLSDKEQVVISLYYYDELTLKEIGKVLELTESRVCQIHTMALIKMRTKLKEYYMM
ncbi:MAG: FliA/WhiG family RNA polymerase sigma factor [Proteobacteria bacterium]|nr:FliA/WhiG family RNA polymerase sigma factor [Pseudomonadota bacterium]